MKIIATGAFLVCWVLLEKKILGCQKDGCLGFAVNVAGATLALMFYLLMCRCHFCRNRNESHLPLTTEEVKVKSGRFRENNHPGQFTLSRLVKLRCVHDYPDDGRSIKEGQVVHARQVCERGRWHSRVRLRGGNSWIPVEYFELEE
jgi:hypothetical protein